MWKSTTFALVFAVPVMTKGGCDGCDPSTDPIDTGTIGVDSGDTGTADPCDSYVAQATDAALAATPRARPELELLAIRLFPSFTANPAAYERLVDDLDAIGTADPAVAGITYRSPYRGDQLLVGMDDATLDEVVDGTYTAWDCANDAYEVHSVTPGTGYALLTFDGTYDVEKMADEYSHFAGVTYAEPNGVIGGGSTVCVVPDGDTWHWRTDEGSGDCPAGCIHHAYSYFVTEADGSVTEHGGWASDMPPITRPAWMDTFEDCP